MTNSGIYLIWSNEHSGWRKPNGYGYSGGLRGVWHDRTPRVRDARACVSRGDLIMPSLPTRAGKT